MNLEYYRGLNCHLGSVVNVAACLGVNYPDAFCTLWSEKDFADDPTHHIYFSKRIYPNLEAIGIKLEPFKPASEKEAADYFYLIPQGELFLIGMDSFHIPWSPVYNNFKETHYFFARKDTKDSLCCFDPTYNKANRQLSSAEAVSHAFEFSRIRKKAVEPPKFSLANEAREILRTHPKTLDELLNAAKKCKIEQCGQSGPLIKQINAMVNNRYLFQRFLHQPQNGGRRFFDGSFFSKWEGIRHGMYKLAIVRKNEGVIDEVCTLLQGLFSEESGIAEQIVLL